MNILISNDDGYLAEGLAVLAQVASEFGEVRVVAPERNRSGVSNALTLNRHLSLHKAHQKNFYFVDGTPTDCIHVAQYALSDFKPDVVLSGINNGANMGDDTLYSGTVAVATEAYLMGFPAIAFSQQSMSGKYWRTSEQVVRVLLAKFFAQPITRPILWNVNIPAVQMDEIKGHRITRLGHRFHSATVATQVSPRGELGYWIGPIGDVADAGEGTDFHACQNGWVSISPLQTDLTAHHQLGELEHYWQGISL